MKCRVFKGHTSRTVDRRQATAIALVKSTTPSIRQHPRQCGATVTEAVPIVDAGPLPFSQLLMHILNEHGGDRLSFSELAARLRDRAWGGLLLIFAAFNLLPLPPGATTVTGLPLLVITAQMAIGRSRPWFPRKLDQRGMGRDHLAKIAAKIAPWEERVEKIFKPRLCGLTSHRA